MLHLPITVPTTDDNFLEWWMSQRLTLRKADRRGFDTLVICASWSMWKQRNARVFNRPEQQLGAPALANNILDEIKEWKVARGGVGGLHPFVRE